MAYGVLGWRRVLCDRTGKAAIGLTGNMVLHKVSGQRGYQGGAKIAARSRAEKYSKYARQIRGSVAQNAMCLMKNVNVYISEH